MKKTNQKRMINPQLYIGLMSGTSADGIDLALVDFSSKHPVLIAKYYQAYDSDTHDAITALYVESANEIDRAFSLDVQLAHQFSSAINHFLQQQSLTPKDIIAIGNHGQTIRHRPSTSADKNSRLVKQPFTLQIGCNQTLATLTGIRVVGQFRKKDMVLGGQGAPLVPAFHQAIFSTNTNPDLPLFVVNIGGIANLSFLPADKSKTLGYDTGPGNALMDDWYQYNHSEGRFDKGGQWASQGQVDDALLMQLLNDEYFQLPAPKSTGREAFHLPWLLEQLARFSVTAVDVQATLAQFTAKTIAEEIKKLSPTGKVLLCGGGVLNSHLCELINQQLNSDSLNKKLNEPKCYQLSTTDDEKVDSEALEAMAFSWFAYAFDHDIPGNIPAVTGATKTAILGNSYNP